MFSALAEKVASEEITAEAVIFQLLHRLPLLARAERVLHLSAEERSQLEEDLRVLAETCHPDSVLAPSLAFLCHLTGRFHSQTRAFGQAREAYERERDIRSRLPPPTVNGPRALFGSQQFSPGD